MQVTKKIYDLQSLNFLQNSKLKVAILGGSFNPAHVGHLSISLQALKALNFDYIIWLVALQNPLKPEYNLDIFARASIAAKLAWHPRILISVAEQDIKSPQTYDILNTLSNKFKSVDFTWLMGVDNIINFHTWYRYQDILALCDIIIFDRPEYSGYINFSRFTSRFNMITAKQQIRQVIFFRGIMNEISSSDIRKKENKNANY